MRVPMVQRMAWDSRHTWRTLDLQCPCTFSVTVRRQELSHPAEDWDVCDTCKHATCGFRSESLQHISQYRRSTLRRTQRTSSQRQQAERHWNDTEKCWDSDMSKLTAVRRNSDWRVWAERTQFDSHRQLILCSSRINDSARG